MGCFCKSAMAPLRDALSSLNTAAPGSSTGNTAASGSSVSNTAAPGSSARNIAASGRPAGAEDVRKLSVWLGARGLPAPPWKPDPAWQHAELPRQAVPAETMTTLLAIANLRAQALTQFGLDLLRQRRPTCSRASLRLSARGCPP